MLWFICDWALLSEGKPEPCMSLSCPLCPTVILHRRAAPSVWRFCPCWTLRQDLILQAGLEPPRLKRMPLNFWPPVSTAPVLGFRHVLPWLSWSVLVTWLGDFCTVCLCYILIPEDWVWQKSKHPWFLSLGLSPLCLHVSFSTVYIAYVRFSPWLPMRV